MSHTKTFYRVPIPLDCPGCGTELPKPLFEIPYVVGCKKCLCFSYSRTFLTYTFEVGFITIIWPARSNDKEMQEDLTRDYNAAVKELKLMVSYEEPTLYVKTWQAIPEHETEARAFELYKFRDWMRDRDPLFEKNVAEVEKQLTLWEKEKQEVYQQNLRDAEYAARFPNQISREIAEELDLEDDAEPWREDDE